jgi:transcriptional regulator with XRE-family HTH domain
MITQAQFGARLGYSGSYIQRIELGSVRPPDRLCESIWRLTGVDKNTLKSKNGRPMMSIERGPLSVDALRRYVEFRNSKDWKSFHLFGLKHAILTLAALGFASRGRADAAVLDSFDEWANNAIREFKLSAAFDREFGERASKWNAIMKKKGEHLRVETTADWSSFASGLRSAMQAACENDGKIPDPESLERSFDRGSD